MTCRSLIPFALAALALPATAQIATSNEDGATGAYSSEVDSSFTSEGRFGPRTAIDDLRAGVDREQELREKLRQKQLRHPGSTASKTAIEPYVPGAEPSEEEGETASEPTNPQ
ncbi:hypothetical protein [Henriciella aquimarina]|uniref:hypothetical protein n=1 Tax=Henriciella aquimarina TaxID=545261 RepID=UPI0009FCD0FB|nr:hypothetical protein [Henriciella aquimarina]